MQPAADSDARTAADRVEDLLRADILSGHLPPGGRLVVASLAQRYGTSPMPIRAALQALQGRGLVTMHPHQGARVRAMDRDTIVDVYELRRAVLGVLLPRCLRHVGDADLEQIAGLADAYDRAVSAGPLTAILEANRRFHHAIYALAGAPEALDVMDRTWVLVDALRLRFGFSPRRLEASRRQHRAMLSALRRRDPATTALFQTASDDAMRDLLALSDGQGRP
jgi:DNA-binding GntR family transcriptional regulator